MIDTRERKALIIGMLDTFPSAANLGAEVVAAMAGATDGFSLEAVQVACQRFKRGEVGNRDNERMPPSAAELVAQVRMIDAGIRMRDGNGVETARIVSYPIGGEPPEGFAPLGPISVNFGHGGDIDMSAMTPAEKEAVLSSAGLPPPKRLEGARPLPRLQKMAGGNG